MLYVICLKISNRNIRYVHNRSLSLFKSAIKSTETEKLYMYYLDEFLRYIKIKNYDDVISLGSKKIQTHLEDWVMHLANKGLTASTIRGKLSNPNNHPTVRSLPEPYPGFNKKHGVIEDNYVIDPKYFINLSDLS